MKIRELMDEIFAWCQDGAAHDYSNTCDTLKCGDPETELHRVAVAMFATPELIRRVREWNAQLLIVHEPTFYDHFERKLENDPVTEAKTRLLQESGIALWRYHDHPHCKNQDMIGEGGVRALDLHGTWRNQRWAVNRFLLDTPMTARELARKYESELGVAHVRVCGAMDIPCTRLSLCFGMPGGVFEELRSPEVEIVLTGEACEWQLGEYARDAAQLGFRKALLILGHIPSEREGMRLLSDRMAVHFSGIQFRYFECGEVYSYPEQP